MQAGVTITGIEEVSAAMGKSEQELREQVKKILNQSAMRIVADAKKASPVDTGRLRASLAILAVHNDGLTLDVGTNIHYSGYVEFGTRHMKARPYLFPAWERERPKLIERLKAIMK